MNKEEYYEHVREVREILSDPENLKCTCPKVKCEWHGNCRKCVAAHRYFKDHVPTCFQNIFNDRIKEMVEIFELKASEKEKNPGEYWDYVREMDEKNRK